MGGIITSVYIYIQHYKTSDVHANTLVSYDLSAHGIMETVTQYTVKVKIQ